jgi:hypothetical protein
MYPLVQETTMNTTLRTLIAMAAAGVLSVPVHAQEATTTATPTDTTDTTTTATDTTVPAPTFDMRTRELRIPCLDVQGIVVHGQQVTSGQFDVVMKQRGQSSNWEITFVGAGCGGTMPPADTPSDTTETTETTDTTSTTDTPSTQTTP